MCASTPKAGILPLAALLAAPLIISHGAVAQTPARGAAEGPAIELPNGLLTGGQRADAPIDIRFVTAPDAAVDLPSLRVWVHKLIGWIDVTDQLLTHPHVHVDKAGIHLDGGVLPAGDHEVRLSFHDLKGRVVDAMGTIRIRAASPI
jgi:hypothetical protein